MTGLALVAGACEDRHPKSTFEIKNGSREFLEQPNDKQVVKQVWKSVTLGPG
jgi:hypothetical protein